MIAGIKCFDFYFVFKSKFLRAKRLKQIETPPPTQFPGVPSPIPLSFLCIPQHMMLFWALATYAAEQIPTASPPRAHTASSRTVAIQYQTKHQRKRKNSQNTKTTPKNTPKTTSHNRGEGPPTRTLVARDRRRNTFNFVFNIFGILGMGD